MKLGVYCRISRLKDGNDLSIEDQKQKGIAKAAELNIPYELYIDEGLSGASDKIEDRPEFERFLGAITSGEITHVFAYDQSRFERNPQIRFIINDLFKKNKVIYYTQMDGLVDLYDPQAEFFGDLLSVINKFHVTTTKLKVKSALRVRAKEGKSKGIMPYGYGKDENGYIKINDEEAAVVKDIYKWSLEGIGTRTIAEKLNEMNIPTRYNKLNNGTLSVKNKYTGEKSTVNKEDIVWSPNTVLSILRNTYYKGERNYSGEVLKVPAIFDAEYFDKVNYNIGLNRNNSGKKVEHQYLLKGLIRCGVCGRNMYGHKRESKHDNHYMCSSKRIKGQNCGNRSINIDRIENFIWLNLFVNGELDKRIESEFKFDQSEVDRLSEKILSLDGKIEALNVERKRAIDLTIKGFIKEDEIADNLADISRKIKELNVIKDDTVLKSSALKYSNDIVEKYNSAFQQYTETSTFEQKKNIINTFINNIIVTYSEDSKDYLLNIEYKIDIPSENVIAKLNKNSTAYYDLDEDGNHLAKYSVESDGNPQSIEWDDDFKEDAEVENESAESNKSFIRPLIDKIVDFHKKDIFIPYPSNVERIEGNELQCVGVLMHPNNVMGNIGFVSWWWKFSATWRNFVIA